MKSPPLYRTVWKTKALGYIMCYGITSITILIKSDTSHLFLYVVCSAQIISRWCHAVSVSQVTLQSLGVS